MIVQSKMLFDGMVHTYISQFHYKRNHITYSAPSFL